MIGSFLLPQLEAPPAWWAAQDELNSLERKRLDFISSALRGGFDYELVKEWATEEFGSLIYDARIKLRSAKGDKSV